MGAQKRDNLSVNLIPFSPIGHLDPILKAAPREIRKSIVSA
jgi:hypothetical protein